MQWIWLLVLGISVFRFRIDVGFRSLCHLFDSISPVCRLYITFSRCYGHNRFRKSKTSNIVLTIFDFNYFRLNFWPSQQAMWSQRFGFVFNHSNIQNNYLDNYLIVNVDCSWMKLIAHYYISWENNCFNGFGIFTFINSSLIIYKPPTATHSNNNSRMNPNIEFHIFKEKFSISTNKQFYALIITDVNCCSLCIMFII